MKSTPPKIYRFKEIDSTTSAAFRSADKGASSGSIFVAEHQTDGHGKWGRKWVSPPGKNLLFSVLLHPRQKVSKAAGVTQIVCRSVARVLQARFDLHPTFKRPNDVMIKERKICGILVESKGSPNGDLESLVIGVGLNVNSEAEELVSGATSIREETGRRQARESLMKELITQMKKDLGEWWIE